MATLAGSQSDLGDMLHSLAELDYDAIDAYSVAIDKIEHPERRRALEEFRGDHQRHVEDLSRELSELGREPPLKADLKSVLAQGKVVLGTITGDKGILKAMRSNEKDTNRAYEKALNRGDLSTELARLLSGNLADERRHLNWIENELSRMEERDEARPGPSELPR
jgi:rubrerythrin